MARPRLVACAVTALLMLAAGATRAGDWLTRPGSVGEAGTTAVTLQFRLPITLETRPREAIVNVTGDNRYILYVNGVRVAAGPSRGDLAHWRTAGVDLAPFLRAGENVIAAEVWNDGRNKPGAQISARTAFRIDARDPALASRLDTGRADWRVRVNTARSVASGLGQVIRAVGPTGYYVAGPPETIDGALQADDWMAPVSSVTDWSVANPALAEGETAPWTLVSDALPQMRFQPVPIGRVVRTDIPGAERTAGGPFVIPAHTTAHILIDAGRVMAAYPEFSVSGGSGSTIEATYAEALYDADRRRLADRAAVGDGRALGLKDTFKPGGQDQVLRPQWWRAWRFLDLAVTTGDAPLTLDRVSASETGYPFVQRARFESDDPQLNAIWAIGWNTVRFDAHETYMDTAYWEQLQYIGDTRIQAQVSYDVSGDPRLAVQAIDAFDHSRVVDGLPQGAWPSNGTNSIPPFALLWVGMLHDYWMEQPDVSVVQRNLEGVRSVLDWYAPYVTAEGLVRQTPGWLFIDWRPGLSEQPKRSDPPRPDSCIISLLYLGALDQAAELEAAVGDADRVVTARDRAQKVRAGVQSQCWSPERGLYADTPEKTSFSQHANALAILYDVAPVSERAAILDRIMVPDSGIDAPAGITGTTYYFSWYLVRALEHAGQADRYAGALKTWRQLLAQNFTTWPESPDPSRSDSHAWSAHPTSDLLRLVAGIQPAGAGYRRVRIAPHLGSLKRLDAAAAHPNGLIEARYTVEGKRLRADIRLPSGISGVFVWRGREHALRPGRNRLSL